jgi:hypothetical protein
LSFLLEPEIKALLEEHRDTELVAESLIQNFQEQIQQDHDDDFYKENVTELCRFFLVSGQFQILVRFCLRHLVNPKFPFPWGYFIEAVSQGTKSLNASTLALIKAGIATEKAEAEVATTSEAHLFVEDANALRLKKKKQRLKKLLELRIRLLDEVITLRTQQLFDEEKAHLVRLLKLFPGDKEIENDLNSHRERRALDILARHSPMGRSARSIENLPDTESKLAGAGVRESFQKNLASSPELAFDFAVAAYMMDDFEICAEILDQAELSLEQVWFRLEVKLKCRRFLEVLQEVNKLELALAADPETFFATAYIRAQAYWGLQQKHIAIEILESILSVRPQYRSGATLLDLWRAQ